MFRPGGPKPWKTKIGESKVDERRSSVEAEQRKASLQEEGKDEVVRADGTIGIVEKDGFGHREDAGV